MNLRKNPEVLAREEEGGRHLMFNRTSQLSLILNNTSFFIWDACNGTRDVNAIVEAIETQYDTSGIGPQPESLAELVATHLSLLQRANLLEADSPIAL